MRIFRYRPLNSLLFKELRYREVYLASPVELNDPLDLNAQIDFAPHGEKDSDALCKFLYRTSVVAHRRLELIPILCKLMGPDYLGAFLKQTPPLEPRQYLNKETLFEAIAQFYRSSASDFSQIGQLNVEDLCDAVDLTCRNVLGNSSVACFSEVNDDFLMWSHYASGHSGICLEFEAAEASEDTCNFPFESFVPVQGKHLAWTESLQRVKYPSILSMLTFYKFYSVFADYGDIDLIHLSKSRWHAFASGIANLYLEKLDAWSSEREWRIVQVQFKETTPEERILNYAGEALKAVFFGAKTSEASKRRIREALRWGTGPRFYQAVVDGSRMVRFRPDKERQ